MVIATHEALVTEEVDVLVLGARDILLGLDVLQAVGFVPAGRENVERNLAADGKAVIMRVSSIHSQLQSLLLNHLRETKIGELLLQGLDHVPPNVVHLVIANVICQSDFIALRLGDQAERTPRTRYAHPRWHYDQWD